MHEPRVLIIRSDAIGWNSVRTAVETLPDARIVGDAADSESVLKIVRQHVPNVVIVGERVAGDDALPLLLELRALLGPEAAMILLVASYDIAQLLSLEPLDLSGFLLWSDVSATTLPHVLAAAIHTDVMTISRRPMMSYLDARLGRSSILQMAERITPREHELLQLLARGYTDEHIAATLQVSARTVRRDVTSLLEKLDVQDRFSLGVEAVRLGLVPFKR